MESGFKSYTQKNCGIAIAGDSSARGKPNSSWLQPYWWRESHAQNSHSINPSFAVHNPNYACFPPLCSFQLMLGENKSQPATQQYVRTMDRGLFGSSNPQSIIQEQMLATHNDLGAKQSTISGLDVTLSQASWFAFSQHQPRGRKQTEFCFVCSQLSQLTTRARHLF